MYDFLAQTPRAYMHLQQADYKLVPRPEGYPNDRDDRAPPARARRDPKARLISTWRVPAAGDPERAGTL